MLLCIKTCVLNGTKRIIEGSTVEDSIVPESAMVYFESIAINPRELNKSLREVCNDILEIKERLGLLECPKKEKNKVEVKEECNKEISNERFYLESKAKELGVSFSNLIGDEKLKERINKKIEELK